MVEDTIPNETIEENKFGYETILVEMRYSLEEAYESISIPKKLGEQILAASSVIVALGSSLQIFNVQIDPRFLGWFNFLVISALILYLALFVLCLKLIFPVKVPGPTGSNWDDLYYGFVFEKTNAEVIKQTISNYISTINKCEPLIEPRRKLAVIVTILLPIIVTLLVLAALIPRTPI